MVAASEGKCFFFDFVTLKHWQVGTNNFYKGKVIMQDPVNAKRVSDINCLGMAR